MGTKDFNSLDLFISRWRSRIVRRHIRSGARILDFGCGHQALFLQSMEKLISQGIGMDYDADPAHPSKNIEIQNFHFKDHFEFPDESFDNITILAVLEHIPLDQLTILLNEFRRILKVGGSLLITTPTPASKPVLEFMAFKLKIISAPEIADHKHYYSEADMRSLAERHKFSCSSYQTFQFGLNSFTALAKSR